MQHKIYVDDVETLINQKTQVQMVCVMARVRCSLERKDKGCERDREGYFGEFLGVDNYFYFEKL